MSNYKTKRFFSDPAILHERTSGEFSVPTCFPSVYAYMHNYSDSYLGQVIVIYMHGHAHGIRHSRYSSICLRFHRYISFDSRKYI
jgi:CRISPR/Cas system-associated endonuclease Cas3-HD